MILMQYRDRLYLAKSYLFHVALVMQSQSFILLSEEASTISVILSKYAQRQVVCYASPGVLTGGI